MGNTPTNAPYEDRFVARLLAWWRESGAHERFQLLFRPHPRDRRWRERFALPAGTTGAAVQEPAYTDLDALATLLQHGDAVVANAGTILLDALVNDRPAVCVLYDEGAPPDDRWAELNVSGEHYRELLESEAFYRARSFEEVVAGIERALAQPGGARGRARARRARGRRRGRRARGRPGRGRDRDDARPRIASAAVARTVLFVGAGRHQRRAIERARGARPPRRRRRPQPRRARAPGGRRGRGRGLLGRRGSGESGSEPQSRRRADRERRSRRARRGGRDGAARAARRSEPTSRT